jgi:type II secretory pathway pseudopilin PulG
MSELNHLRWSIGFGESIASILVIVVLGAIALPNFIKARSVSSANACIKNLRQINAAANQFALEKGKTNGETINFQIDLTPYIKLNSLGKIPGCPMGGTYFIWKVGQTPRCTLEFTNSAHALQ